MWLFCSDLVKKIATPSQVEDEEVAEQKDHAGQEHCFAFWSEISSEEQLQLEHEFNSVDDNLVEEAVVKARERHIETQQGYRILDPPNHMDWGLKKAPTAEPGSNLTIYETVHDRRKHAWRMSGFVNYERGRIGIIILCGGMDSRLAEGVPKGVVDIGLLSHKSIFQLYAERIRRLQHLVDRKFDKEGTSIPLYIMCNRTNAPVIETFWRENNFFGIHRKDIMFFIQGDMPAVNKRGKLLLAEKHKIAKFPSGNGGVFRALAEWGMVADMKSRGVTSMYVCSIDNVLCKIGDPMFVGYCDMCNAEAGIKCFEKIAPEERVGVFCSRRIVSYEDVDGDGTLDVARFKFKAAVYEFWELTEDQNKQRGNSKGGGLLISAGNLSQYYFKVDFAMRIFPKMELSWHFIPKSLRHVDPWTGDVIVPREGEKNAYRLEMWIFDSFEWSNRVVGLQVGRDEYALVKNTLGVDSPQTALQTMGRLHQQWILDAGGAFFDNRVASDREDSKCEISPLVSYEGEDLTGQFLQQIQLPYYLPSDQELWTSAVPPVQEKRQSLHYLDWEETLAQRELDSELKMALGNVLHVLHGDQDKLDTVRQYQGEKAEDEEVLPPTPRHRGGRKQQITETALTKAEDKKHKETDAQQSQVEAEESQMDLSKDETRSDKPTAKRAKMMWRFKNSNPEDSRTRKTLGAPRGGRLGARGESPGAGAKAKAGNIWNEVVELQVKLEDMEPTPRENPQEKEKKHRHSMEHKGGKGKEGKSHGKGKGGEGETHEARPSNYRRGNRSSLHNKNAVEFWSQKGPT